MSIGPTSGAADSGAFRATGIIERRRSTRRLLREPSEVTVRHEENGTGWRCSGNLLNLSADGIAVRLPVRDLPKTLTAGDTVQVTFRVGGDGTDFDRVCRIVNVTVGATPGRNVVGLEFIVDARSQPDRERLQAAISRALETDG